MPTEKGVAQIGWEEWVALPELNLPAIKAKVDTGAKTSSIHAFMVEKIVEGGDVKVRFGIHPIPERPDIELYCKAHLVDERQVISSNGQTELRYVIRTMARFGKQKWPIELTLTDRETMAYRMLIGRSAMEERLIVVPEKSFLLGKLSPLAYQNVPLKKRKRSLDICIFSQNPDHYTTERLSSVAQSRGHKVEVINPTRCYVDINVKNPAVHYQNTILPRYDVLVPRISPAITFYGVAILRQFENLGIFSLNSSTAISYSRDRLLAHQMLNRGGIMMPTTAFAHYPGDIKGMIKLLGGAPLLIKLLDGNHGKGGVVLAPTNQAAQAVIHAFQGLNANFIAQEYIKEPDSKDIRCIVLGNKVIAAIEKGSSDKIRLTLQEKRLAIKATRILGLKFAGVNMLRTSEGPKILDVNASPALRHIERITKLDVVSLIIEYIEHHARPKLPKRIMGYHS